MQQLQLSTFGTFFGGGGGLNKKLPDLTPLFFLEPVSLCCLSGHHLGAPLEVVRSDFAQSLGPRITVLRWLSGFVVVGEVI